MKEAGLVTFWKAWGGKPAVRESVKFQIIYDWDSPLWACNAGAVRRLEKLGLASGKLLERKTPDQGCEGWEGTPGFAQTPGNATAVMPFVLLESIVAVS